MAFFRAVSGLTRKRSFGRVVQRKDGKVLLQYFDCPGESERPTQWLPAKEVVQTSLPTQTRVFVNSTDRRHWQVGRVLHGEGETLLIQLPNAMPTNYPAERVFVRWAQPISDPTTFLASEITETPLFAEARSNFMNAVIAQRSASLGMGAYLSAQIELNAYQFAVIKRVLQDPVQRYLLADEVGLGKTIEAGVLIRQYFLDEPETARAIVLAPSALVGQWRQELIQRFSLGDFLDDVLHIVSTEDIDQLADLIDDVGMLVIDEAHHLSHPATLSGSVLYETIRSYASRIPRLLLLSATPALVDEQGFLRMVHLLDPIVFPLDDLDGFRKRIASRQDVAETVAALLPENMLILDTYLDRLLDSFAGDELLQSHIETLRVVLARFPEEDDPAFLSALEQLRTHLSEIYRLHRRILRNRRKSVPAWVTPNRSGLHVWEYEDAATGHFSTIAEALRLAVANDDAADDVSIAALLFKAALDPMPEAAIDEVARRFEGDDGEVTQALADLRRARAEVVEGDARVSRLFAGIEELLKQHYQVIVFCGNEELADNVFAELQVGYDARVARHVPLFDEDEPDPDWHRFLHDSRCKILVCDQHAEEGLNLHGGRKAVVHFDIPASPNRLEQRLGRVDRYGAGDDIRSFALACTDNQLEMAWLQCLDKGFGVFSQSIASLQYLVDALLSELSNGWLEQGPHYIEKATAELAGPDGKVQVELRRIDQQDTLDSFVAIESTDQFDRLEEADEDWQSFGDAVDEFVFRALRFHKRPTRWSGKLVDHDQVFRIGYSYNQSDQTLITMSEFLENFLQAQDVEAPGANYRTPQTHPYTYRRPTALTTEGKKQGVRLLRYGEEFIEGLMRFTIHDDRGRVFAMWRYRPDFVPTNDIGVDLYFRFDFVVEVSLDPAQSILANSSEIHARVGSQAARRTADGLMAPRFVRVWLDDQMRLVEAPPAELLEQYRKKASMQNDGRDFNLNPDRWNALHTKDVASLDQWAALCGKARIVAEESLRQHPTFKESIRIALTHARQLHSTLDIQMRARIEKLVGNVREAEQADHARQHAIFCALEEGIASPSIRLDSVGAIFLSNYNAFLGPE